MAEDIGVAQEFIATVVNMTSGTGVTVHEGPCIVRGYYINDTLSANVVSIEDNAGTVKFVIPASSEGGNSRSLFDATQDGLAFLIMGRLQARFLLFGSHLA